MSRPVSTVPTLRLHKPSNRAVVTGRQANGRTKDLYVGRTARLPYRAQYNRIAAVIVANGVYPEVADVTVAEALFRYAKYVVGY